MSISASKYCHLRYLVKHLLFVAACLALSVTAQAQEAAQLFAEFQGQLNDLEETRFNEVRSKAFVVSGALVQPYFHINIATETSLQFPVVGSNVVFIRTKIVETGRHMYTWTGELIGGSGLAVLVSDQGQVTGYIRVEDRQYKLEPISPRVSALLEIDAREFEKEGGPIIDDTATRGAMKGGGAAQYDTQMAILASGTPHVRLMVVYSDDALLFNPNIESDIAVGVGLVNSSYDNSGINLDLLLVHTEEVLYNETGNSDTTIAHLRNTNDNQIDGVHSLRDQYNADVVLLVVKTLDFAGIAYLYGGETSAFGVIKSDYEDKLTVAHEIGHVQGAHHNPETGENNPYFPYGYGHLIPDLGARTVMAYDTDDRCCSNRIEYFSNPNVQYSGYPTGTSSEDNARVLNETSGEISLYRVTPMDNHTISGPSCIVEGNDGNFSAYADEGEPPFSFTWEVYPLCSSLSKTGDGDVGTLGLPCGSWSYAGSGEWLQFGSSQNDDFKMRATASDAASQNMLSNTLLVNVEPNTSPDPCGSLSKAEEDVPEKPARTSAYAIDASSVYPNPFNPATTIRFSLTEPSSITLTIFDVMGRRVEVLKHGATFQAGNHSVIWSADALPSGMYIYRLETDVDQHSGRMLLAR